MLLLLLALPALRADDKPKDEAKPPSPKQQYNALLKDFSAQQREILTAAQKVKGDEQQKLFQKYMGVGKEFADKFYKIAEDHPEDPAATDALFWIVQNGAGSPVHAKAMEKVTQLVAEMPLKDLTARLNLIRDGRAGLAEAVFKRAEKAGADPLCADLFGWLAINGAYSAFGEKAIDRLVQRYPDHAAVSRVCANLARGGSPKAIDTLKKILEKAGKPQVKAAAALALGQNLAAQTDGLADKPAESEKIAAEAEKYFTMAIDTLADNAEMRKAAEIELKAFRTLRVGKEAPEISGADLDAKEFKLSDYRGKVVLLDFWGNW